MCFTGNRYPISFLRAILLPPKGVLATSGCDTVIKSYPHPPPEPSPMHHIYIHMKSTCVFLVISGITKSIMCDSPPLFFFSCLTLHPQQGRKGSFCPLSWFPTSSRIIVTNNPWLRLVLTMTTTALILVMAVLNMVRRKRCDFG